MKRFCMRRYSITVRPIHVLGVLLLLSLGFSCYQNVVLFLDFSFSYLYRRPVVAMADEVRPWYHVPGSVNQSSTIAVRFAYYRPLAEKVVLVILSDAVTLRKVNKWPYSHYCAYYDSYGSLMYVANGSLYTRYLMHCDIIIAAGKKARLPQFVKLFRNNSFWNPETQLPEWLIPVENNYNEFVKNKQQYEGEFAVCVKILYDQPSFLQLVQFFEYYKMHNATKFFLKVRQKGLPSYVSTIIDHYREQNLVHLLPWNAEYRFCPKFDKWCQLAQINDCVLRASYRYRFVAVADYDELLIAANKSLSLMQLIHSLDQPTFGSFTFPAEYHVTHDPANEKPPQKVTWLNAKTAHAYGKTKSMLDKNFPMEKWNYTGDHIITRAYSPKTIVKPETVAKMWVHFPRFHYKGYKNFGLRGDKHGYFLHFKNSSAWSQMKQTYRWAKYKHVDIWKTDLKSTADELKSAMQQALMQVFDKDNTNKSPEQQVGKREVKNSALKTTNKQNQSMEKNNKRKDVTQSKETPKQQQSDVNKSTITAKTITTRKTIGSLKTSTIKSVNTLEQKPKTTGNNKTTRVTGKPISESEEKQKISVI